MGRGDIRVSTLGSFFIGASYNVCDPAAQSQKEWELFKLLLAYRSRKISTGIILGALWPRTEPGDSKAVLGPVLYMLRKILERIPGSTFRLIVDEESYGLELGNNTTHDIEDLCKLAKSVGNINRVEDALATLGELQRVYKGDYYSELAHSEWVLPLRNYYRRLYLESTYKLLKFLRAYKRTEEVIQGCELALLTEPFDQEINICLLETLHECGQQERAIAHYEYISGKMNNEIGANPAPAVSDIYKRIAFPTPRQHVDSILEGLQAKTKVGAILCEPEVFRTLFDFEVRRLDRTARALTLCLLTITSDKPSPEARSLIQESTATLKTVCIKSLRRGDIVTQWTDNQCLVLLNTLSSEQAGMVIARLQRNFERSSTISGVFLGISSQFVTPLSILEQCAPAQ